MTRPFSLALALAALGLATAPAHAAVTELYRSGLWSAYSDSGDGRGHLCGIATQGGDRRIAIEQHAGETGIDIRLTKTSWTIPDGTAVSVRFAFDRRAPTSAPATGAGQTLRVHLTFEQSVPFMRALRFGSVMQVLFPDGNEPPWSGGLAGSGNSITAFNRCRAALNPPEPTQPFPTPAQPAAPAPVTPAPAPVAPTQPFPAPAAPPTPAPPG
jgi:hypothetical protein